MRLKVSFVIFCAAFAHKARQLRDAPAALADDQSVVQQPKGKAGALAEARRLYEDEPGAAVPPTTTTSGPSTSSSSSTTTVSTTEKPERHADPDDDDGEELGHTGGRDDPADGTPRARSGPFFDNLYQQRGHDAAPDVTPARELVLDISGDSSIRSVLHIGCADGAGVELLWNHSIVASGVDASPAAVGRALQRTGTARYSHPRVPNASCVAPCFAVAAPEKVPYGDRSFDAVMVTGVLEYLPADAVGKAFAEFARVGRNSLYLNVSAKLHGAAQCRDAVTTCRTLRWWRDTAEKQTNLTCEIGLRKEIACERAIRPVAPRLMRYAAFCALVPVTLLLVFWFPRESGAKFTPS